jgi:putative phosphoesterase
LKILSLSDLHLDINKENSQKILNQLLEIIQKNSIDIFIIAGDIAANLKVIAEFFNRFIDIEIPKLYVPGNHDLWVNENQTLNSHLKYYEILPEIASTFEWHYLPQKPLKIDDVAFIGSVGWYDYSTRNKDLDAILSYEHYEQKVNPTNKVWMDKQFITWNRNISDKDLTTKFLTEMLFDLKSLNFKTILQENHNSLTNSMINENIANLIAITHTVPDEEIIYRTNNINIDYFHAFLGSNRIGELLDTILDTRVINLCGHYHRKSEIIKGNREIYTTPLGYHHEWQKYHSSMTIEEIVNYKSSIIDLNSKNDN